MLVQDQIQQKLQQNFTPEFLEVVNESHMHSGPADAETHYKVTLVTAAFDGTRKVARHQKVYQVLAEELAGPVHALALHTYTHDEWAERQQSSPDSPDCRGGSKA